jgi:Xaa-Pro aminopeptidase
MDVTRRLEALRATLGESEYDAFVAQAVPNVAYLTGFDGVWDTEPSSLVLVTESIALVVTDSRFEAAAAQAAGRGPLSVRVCVTDPWSLVGELLSELAISRIAVEDSLPYAEVQRVRGQLSVEVTPVADWVEQLRTSKDAEEIARIAAAQALTDDALDHILGFISEGMTETQIALELEFFMRRHGSDGVAFSPIVASGPNSALPHARPGSRVLARGDFLKMDFGARVGGYCADMTRTIVLGAASARQREIYAAVLAANLAGLAAVRPGRAGLDIDAAARAVIADAGFAEKFGHGLGHGVGLEVHERPGVGARSDKPVPLGSVITIEPGVYVPGFGGVRIEDLVVVEEAGACVLTRSAKELIEL